MRSALVSAALGLAVHGSHHVDAGPPAALPPATGAGSEHPLHITADHLTVLTKENRTEWTGHVHVVRPAENGQPPVDIRCQKMNTTASSPVDAGGKEGGSKVDKVFCHGDVVVQQGDRGGTGDEAILDNVASIVTMTGRPHGHDGATRYSGNLLTFFLDQNRLEMSGSVVVDTPSEGGPLSGGGSPAVDGGASPARTEPGSKR